MRVRYPDSLCDSSKDWLDQHVRDMETKRKDLAMQGNAIILALIDDPRLLKSGVPQLEEDDEEGCIFG